MEFKDNPKKYDIGLVGCWSAPNYGAHLTYYALYKMLTDEKYDVLLIETTKTWRVSQIPPLFRINPYPNHALANIYTEVIDMQELNEYCDTFMTGSDQLWNYWIFGLSESYTLAFVNSDKRKMAYATSFGKSPNKVPCEITAKMKYLLNRFDKISVREYDGVNICNNRFDIQADWVLDPVFLCDIKHYEELIKKSAAIVDSPYIFCYITAQTEQKRIIIEQLAKKLNQKVVFVHVYYSPKCDWKFDGIEFCRYDTQDCKVEDWLYYLYKSSIVITDSYHGYCFSLIFNKQVITLFTDEIVAERANSLADLLEIQRPGIADENFDADDCFNTYKNDYELIGRNLKKEKERCKKWIYDALKTKVTYDKYDLMWDTMGLEILHLQRRIAEQQIEINRLKCKDKKIVLFGAGKLLDYYYAKIKSIVDVEYISDNDPLKWDTVMCDGIQCINPEKLLELADPYVIVTVKDKKVSKLIINKLQDMGLKNVIHISEFIFD